MSNDKTVLARRNLHERDFNIRFHEYGHRYEIITDPGKRYTSVTTLVHSQFPKFNADLIIDKIMKSKSWAPGHKYWGLTANEIKALWNSNGSAAANSGTNLPNLSFRTFCYKADTIYAAGITAAGALFYAAFDTNFNLFYTSNSIINSAVPSGICTGNDRNLRLISLASSEQTFNDTHTFSNFSQFAKGNAIIATKDIGVVDAQVLGYLVTHNSPPGQTLISCSVQATVKNYGNDTVKYFKLNSFAKVASISYCLIGLHQAFTTTLPPGGTVVVSSKAFYMPPIPIAAIQNATHVVSQFCLYTSVPDSTIDYEVSNNSACKNFTFSLLQTGIEESLTENRISVFPNPVTAQLQIKSAETIGAVKMYNVNGAEVFSSSNETKTLEIDCRNFVPGVYSICTKIGEAWLRKKIVVE
jgi:hypothetical protein